VRQFYRESADANGTGTGAATSTLHWYRTASQNSPLDIPRYP